MESSIEIEPAALPEQISASADQPSASTDISAQPGPAPSTDAIEARDAPGEAEKDPRYPLTILYCSICTLPPEIHEYHSKSQFEKCKEWLRRNSPQHFPDLFPDECVARLEALRIAEETGETIAVVEEEDEIKVAKPIEQKTSGGKKKKAPAEIMLALGQRKGKKQVTIVYGLDLFGIKLKEAAKAAKRKFATGSSITVSPDNRDVIEIQGCHQQGMAQLVHTDWGVPLEVIYIINPQKKKVKAFP